jgi:hypothetical protein
MQDFPIPVFTPTLPDPFPRHSTLATEGKKPGSCNPGSMQKKGIFPQRLTFMVLFSF